MLVCYSISIQIVTLQSKPSFWICIFLIYTISENIYLLFAWFYKNSNLQKVALVSFFNSNFTISIKCISIQNKATQEEVNHKGG